MQITAAVVRERSGPFVIDSLELVEPRPDEVLVRVAAAGMCATDLHGRDGYYNTPYPCVYGHEGAGVVEAVGTSVKSLAVGDHVIMSFPWCGSCANCQRDMHSHCQKSFAWKFSGMRPDGSTVLSRNGAPVYSAYFQ
jgi:aryl-alcohol dehydrogenase